MERTGARKDEGREGKITFDQLRAFGLYILPTLSLSFPGIHIPALEDCSED